ncbi:alkaline phosphatase D family protein [Streptomyces roseoverticillatus]|uniref:alkaline phosphatase D family protein n=1 Tax=Streptomyces roseoverticillatus TaxID=66429 RepID=UPI0005BDF551|nr:alkaline phosphatase D family protein [Streptomyces roseoverticillatus]
MTPLSGNPFTLGVASGDPLPDSVVLWTRLAPAPHEPGNGLPADGSIAVQWELSEDDTFRRVVQSGTAAAPAADSHTVHVDLRGLGPDRVYWYRFRADRWISPVGRTRTAPRPDAAVATARFGLLSCQQFDEGYYTALGHLAREDLDAVFFVGDYIYENAINAQGGARRLADPLPSFYDHWTLTLEDYRQRYALYKSDPELQAAHAAHPWYVTWDDHEVANNYAGDISQDNDPVDQFRARRAAAYRAYWENMPLRRPQRPDGPDMNLYRRFSYGRLAQFDILDTRQYRSDQAYGDGWHAPGPETRDPARTITGDAQERWLLDGFRASTATWNVVAQQVAFSQHKETPDDDARVSMDTWDGYSASRGRVLAGVGQAGIQNLVVLTGDDHVHFAYDVKKDFDDPDSATLGVELLGTSVSSGFDGDERLPDWETTLAANPHLKYYDGRRGYVVVTLDPQRVRGDFRTIAKVTTPGAPIATAASFVSEVGAPGLHRA